MNTSGITATLPAQDLGRAKAFYIEKVGAPGCRIPLPQGKRRAGGPHRRRWCQPARPLSRQGEVVR